MDPGARLNSALHLRGQMQAVERAQRRKLDQARRVVT